MLTFMDQSGPIMFNVANEKPLSVNVGGKSKMKPIQSYGVKMLSIGFFTKPDQAVIWRGTNGCKSIEPNDF